MVAKRQTRSKMHLVLHWLNRSLRGPIDSHKWLADVLMSPQALQAIPETQAHINEHNSCLWTLGHHFSNSTRANVTKLLLMSIASVFNIGLIEFRQGQELQRKIRDHLGIPLPRKQDQQQLITDEKFDHQLAVTRIFP